MKQPRGILGRELPECTVAWEVYDFIFTGWSSTFTWFLWVVWKTQHDDSGVRLSAHQAECVDRPGSPEPDQNQWVDSDRLSYSLWVNLADETVPQDILFSFVTTSSELTADEARLDLWGAAGPSHLRFHNKMKLNSSQLCDLWPPASALWVYGNSSLGTRLIEYKSVYIHSDNYKKAISMLRNKCNTVIWLTNLQHMKGFYFEEFAMPLVYFLLCSWF